MCARCRARTDDEWRTLDLGARPQTPVEAARIARGRRECTLAWASLPYAAGQVAGEFSVTHVKNERSATVEYDVYQIAGAQAPLARAFMELVVAEDFKLTALDGRSYLLRVPTTYYLRAYLLPFDLDAPLVAELARYVGAALACAGAALYIHTLTSP
jgi:hypothetical protein